MPNRAVKVGSDWVGWWLSDIAASCRMLLCRERGFMWDLNGVSYGIEWLGARGLDWLGAGLG